MARQPQVVTAVIRPCQSPVAKQKKIVLTPHLPLTHKGTRIKPGATCPSQGRQLGGSSTSSRLGIKQPNASVKSKTKSFLPPGNAGNKHVVPSAPTNTNATKITSKTLSSAVRNPVKPRVPPARRSQITTPCLSDVGSRRSARAASVSSESHRKRNERAPSSSSGKRRQTSISSRSNASKKSSSLSSRAPLTSSAGQKTSGISPVSSKTRYPKTTSATSWASDRTPSCRSSRIAATTAELRALGYSPAHEARLNRLKGTLDRLRGVSPRLASPEFTSTRTDLVAPCGAVNQHQKVHQPPPNLSAMFDLREPPDCSRVAAAGGRRGVFCVETPNRAGQLGVGDIGSVVRQTRRDLPAVSYPVRLHSSSSQTRARSAVSPRVERLARAAAAAGGGAPRRSVAAVRSACDSRRRGVKRPAVPPSPAAGRPVTIDYSPRSRYMQQLVRRGAVRRPTDKENAPPGGRGRGQTAGRRASVTSEPTRQHSRKSILRTSTTSSYTNCEPAPPHHGSEWISSMVDLAATLPNTRKDVEATRKFRDKNYSETHARRSWKDTASEQRNRPSDHKCVHEYYINCRLFPEPLYTDSEGRSQCPVCLAVGPTPTEQRRRAPALSPTPVGRRSRSPVSVGRSGGGRGRSRSTAPSRPGRSRSPTPSRAGRSRSRSRSPTPSRAGRSRSPTPSRLGRSFSRSPMPSRADRCRSLTPSRADRSPSHSPTPRGAGRSRSSAPFRAGRPGSSVVARHGSEGSIVPTPAASRRASSVSWQDEVTRPAHNTAAVCPTCRQPVAVQLDTAEPAPAAAARAGRRRSSPRRSSSRRSSPRLSSPRPSSPRPSSPRPSSPRRPVILRSRPPASRHPVRAMVTVPSALFDARAEATVRALSDCYGDAVESCDGDPCDGDPLQMQMDDWPSRTDAERRRLHPLWPRQLDVPAGLRPIARGWPRLDDRGEPNRASNRLRNASMATGRDPTPVRSIEVISAVRAAKNTYSLRRCIGEKIRA